MFTSLIKGSHCKNLIIIYLLYTFMHIFANILRFHTRHKIQFLTQFYCIFVCLSLIEGVASIIGSNPHMPTLLFF